MFSYLACFLACSVSFCVFLLIANLRYVRLLVEEINEGSCIDPRITASRAVVCELQRVSQMCISDHAEKIHALVSFDSH